MRVGGDDLGLLLHPGSTALHSIEHGFRTVLVEDASRGVDVADMKAMRDRLVKNGAVVVDADEVSCIVVVVVHPLIPARFLSIFDENLGPAFAELILALIHVCCLAGA